MPLNPLPPPIGDPIANPRRQRYIDKKEQDPLEGLIGDAWRDYLTQQALDLSNALTSVNTASVATQGASIAATDFSGGGLAAGLYQVAVYAAITQASGATSSLTVTIGWTDLGIAKSYTAPAITGNTTATTQPDTALLIRSDGATPITYSTVYASAGVPAMLYDLVVTLRQAGA